MQEKDEYCTKESDMDERKLKYNLEQVVNHAGTVLRYAQIRVQTST